LQPLNGSRQVFCFLPLLQWIKAKAVPYNLVVIFQYLKIIKLGHCQNNGKFLPLIGKNPASAIRFIFYTPRTPLNKQQPI
jgi:hypothetical protein